jgi:PAS domain S-box-containing protein
LRNRLVRILEILLFSAALLDITTSWTFLSPGLALALLAGCVTGLILSRGWMRFAWFGLLAVAFASHLSYSEYVRYESRNWKEVRARKAAEAVTQSLAAIEEISSGVWSMASRAAVNESVVAGLESGDYRGVFAGLEEVNESTAGAHGPHGLMAADLAGKVAAWAGRLPGEVDGVAVPHTPGELRFFGSATGYWMEASLPVEDAGGVRGWTSALVMVDARYPSVLPHGIDLTLSEFLSDRVKHIVEFTPYGADASGEEEAVPLDSAYTVTARVDLPEGPPIGTIRVAGRSVEYEKRLLRRQGLLPASILVLALLVLGSARLAYHLLGPRLAGAGYLNVTLFCLVLAGLRLGLSILRTPLGLSSVEPFSAYYYATQSPGGILRSPADLAITAGLACLGATVVIAAWVGRSRHRGKKPGLTGLMYLPHMMTGVVGAGAAAAFVAAASYLLRSVYADTSMNLLSLSPIAPSWPEIAMKAGLFLLSAAILLTGSGLAAWGIGAFRRGLSGGARSGRPVAVGGIAFLIFAVIFAALGAGWTLLVAALLCLAGAVLVDAVRMRKLSPGFVGPSVGLVGLTVGFVLGASLLQFPYALDDFYSHEREAIEAASLGIGSRADEWKISVLDGTVREISEDAEIKDALRSGSADYDAQALRLWAGTFISKSHSPSGVYIMDANGRELGRFSVEDVGEFGELEGLVREARLSPVPTHLRRRATIGGRDVEIYIGVAPVTAEGEYLGAVIVSLPSFYSNLESIAGIKTTFFEALSGLSRSARATRAYYATYVSAMRIVESTAQDFEVGSRIEELEGLEGRGPVWIRHKVGGNALESYFVPEDGGLTGTLFSFRRLTLSEKAVYFVVVTVTNLLFALLLIAVVGIALALKRLMRAARGLPYSGLRWSFARRLALAFVLIATVPTLILGATSRGYLSARLREVMESKAGESLRLAKLSLERLIMDEAMHLAQNPILIDELSEEPSILAMLVSPEVSAAVFDSRGGNLATFGEPDVPIGLVGSVIATGRSYYYYDVGEGLTGKAVVPVRDMLFPDRIRGCAFVSRRIDDRVARELSSQLDRDVNFYGAPLLEATSKREVFVAELMPDRVSPDAYVECFLRGRDVHYAWEKIEAADLVVGYSPLRDVGGRPVGAVSVPLVFAKDDVGRRLEWTVSAISYLLVVVIGIVFAVGLVVARRISTPIRRLIQGTMRVSSGDLSFSIPRTGDDEIGDLISSFNKMTNALGRSRKALNERKRYIETILSNVGAGIVSTDARGRIATFNNAAERILNVKGRNARGRHAGRLLSRSGADGLAEVMKRLDREDVVREEISFARRDGTVMTLRAVGSRMAGSHRKTLGKVIVFEDISGLIRSKKLTAWSEMARQVAHEIKNPLTPMKLSAQQLLQAHKDRKEDFGAVLEDGVAIIIEQIESLRRIAVEFSQFSRMPERKVEPTDLNKVVVESLAQYERALAPSVEITKDLRSPLPPVNVDRDEIKRVFLNIIENAVQAMPGGGRLHVVSGVGKLKVGAACEFIASSRAAGDAVLGDFAEIAFWDTGVGIPRQNSDKLFEPSFSTKTQGSGLGLAISKGIIDAYGGEIVIESEKNEGTLVRVRIPYKGSPSAGRRTRRKGSRWKRRPRRV